MKTGSEERKTVNDVSFVGSTTTCMKRENVYAKYSAPVTESGSYTIDFVKGAVIAVGNVQETVGQKQSAAKTPFPILGILAGLGIAGLVAIRRRK